MLYRSLLDGLSGRRKFLQASAGGIMLASLSNCSQSQNTNNKTATIDFENPEENLKAFIKTTASLDPTAETAGWFGGTLYANIGVEKMMPLVGVEGLGMMRVEPQGNNVYRIFNREFAVYKDLKTEEYLDNWTNPYTD